MVRSNNTGGANAAHKYPFHPACTVFPQLSEAELRELAANIAVGTRTKIAGSFSISFAGSQEGVSFASPSCTSWISFVSFAFAAQLN